MLCASIVGVVGAVSGSDSGSSNCTVPGASPIGTASTSTSVS